MEKDILVSVIIPVYNLQDYIERCVRSVLDQTYSNLELIIVDDGSTDKSKLVIERLAAKDKRIKAIYKENGGVTSARMEGIRHANGMYIGFVDGDDEIEPDMYELLLNNARENNADISHCGYQILFSDGRINYFHNTKKTKIQGHETGIKDLLDGSLIEPGLCNKLFHKKLFKPLLQSNIIDYSIKINEDLLMNFYLFSQAQKSVYIDVCKYHYMIRSNSATKSKMNKNKIYDPIRVKQIILNKCEDNLKSFAEAMLLRTSVYCYCSLIGEKEYSSEKKEIRKLVKIHSHCKNQLSKKLQLLVNGIIFFPQVFEVVYPIYTNHFQNKRYD